MMSVVCSTYNRGHLLRKSLECYANQLLSVPFEIIVLDDGSSDDTEDVVRDWANDIDIKYVALWTNKKVWRDCAMTLNMGIRAAKGDVIICTHPEVMPGPCSLQDLWDNRAEKTYLACKVYYLTPRDQERLDGLAILTYDAPAAVRSLPDFYRQHSTEVRGNPDYTPQMMDKHTSWNSFVFGGFTKETWRWFGGFTEFAQWGSIDVDFLNRRNVLGIPTYTAMEPDTFVVHQNHDVMTHSTDVLTPRDMDKAMSNLPVYRTPDEARLGHI